MLLLQAILPFLATFILATTSTLHLQADIAKDLQLLQHDSGLYISDNTSASPSVQTVTSDLQLFGVVAGINLAKATYSDHKLGNHYVEKWVFPTGEINAIYQIKSIIQLDTVVTQRYLDHRTPTKQHIVNTFTFYTYAVVTASATPKLYYQTEQDQGLLAYTIGNQHVQIGYATTKQGLVDVLPQVAEQVQKLLKIPTE